MKKIKNISLENKKTTELLDTLHDLTKYDREYSKEEDTSRSEIHEELLLRQPFFSLNMPDDETSLKDVVKEFSEDIKHLKRHKHDEKNGDVLIRI